MASAGRVLLHQRRTISSTAKPSAAWKSLTTRHPCALAALLHFSSFGDSSATAAFLPTGAYSTPTGSVGAAPSSLLAWCSRTNSAGWAAVAAPPKSTSRSSFLQQRNTKRNMSSGDASCAPFTVAQFPCLSDNYGYLIHDAATGQTAAIDTPDAEAYKRELNRRGWKLTHIMNTHHHFDHVGGNLDLKTDGVTVYGPENDGNIPGMDVCLKAGETVAFGETEAMVLDVGGHTKGHIAYHFRAENTVFVGDALFALGCGRMFEGTPTQFWTSLKGLRELPDETMVYCAHEYTESNAKFAQSIEPGNADLMTRIVDVRAKRTRGEPTVPSNLGDEKKTNPFLRVDLSDEIRRNVGGKEGDSDVDVFAKVRRAKDTFRG